MKVKLSFTPEQATKAWRWSRVTDSTDSKNAIFYPLILSSRTLDKGVGYCVILSDLSARGTLVELLLLRYFLQLLHLLTYLLTPWSRVLPEKLASLQLVKKFPAFYGTRRFLTALTCARHLSLS